ncbi:alpha/beta hydrolase [Streptomyces sp. A7024]|uniref:Alpha/beta hydrolase n=1 Tax=Streptomyces coryli TaxID=1128680 RepID=A0A6G4U8K9_9ACTN|nr:alpha/beta hydrolase [Streptomyces coryli]NGN67637.1 alpha/beta hydrolase [Streptomyces coryli]
MSTKGTSGISRRAAASSTTAALALLAPALLGGCAEAKPDLGRFYDQRIRWAACTGQDRPRNTEGDAAAGMQCAKLTVPVDYAEPAQGTIKIALARFHRQQNDKGSVVTNFGGPGASGVDSLPGFREHGSRLAPGYDLVSFDPRGVGRSSPLRCGDEAAEDRLERELVENAPAPGDAADDVAGAKEYAAACHRDNGPVIDHVGTLDTARDLDVLRQALGEQKLHYFGISYGTRLGATYAGRFPDRTGRMVLDAVDTLDLPAERDGRALARASQQALDAFAADCAARAGCALGTTADQVRGTIEAETDRLTAAPVRMPGGKDFTAPDLRNAIWAALLSRSFWPQLEQGLARLVRSGDPEILAGFNQGMDSVLEGGGTEALIAVNCQDDPVRPADPARVTAEERKRLTAEYPYFAPMVGGLAATCAGWPAGTGFIRGIDRPRGPEILAIGTRIDPATPYEWAEETARKLGATLVTYDSVGHGANGSPCVAKKITAFYASGTLPPEGTTCPADEPTG